MNNNFFRLNVDKLLTKLPNPVTFNESQKAMIEGLNANRFFVHIAARRTGKSYAAAILAFAKLLEPGQQGMVVAPNFSLSSIIWDYVTDLIKQLEIEVDKFTEGTVNVPVLIKNIPQNVSINYFPKYISVTYYLPLSDYGKFQASDFKIECDYMESQNSEFTFMIAELIKIPKSVKKARLSIDKVEFIFLK